MPAVYADRANGNSIYPVGGKSRSFLPHPQPDGSRPRNRGATPRVIIWVGRRALQLFAHPRPYRRSSDRRFVRSQPSVLCGAIDLHTSAKAELRELIQTPGSRGRRSAAAALGLARTRKVGSARFRPRADQVYVLVAIVQWLSSSRNVIEPVRDSSAVNDAGTHTGHGPRRR